jgi:glycosyltransferase involved in cell wall biosynthesis
MRIACLATSRVPSRAANSIRVMKVAEALARLGHDVRLWVPGEGAGASWDTLAQQYRLRQQFEIDWLRAWAPLRRWDFSLRACVEAIRWEPDLFYVWPYQAGAALSILGKATVLEVHDVPKRLAGPVLFRQFLQGRGAKRLLVITEALRQALAARFGSKVAPPFTVVTPSGVDVAAYDNLPGPAAARTALGWPERFTASYTGQLYAGRGLELMLDLARDNPEVAFVWAGGEDESVRQWRTRVEARGIGNVRLLGFVSLEDLPSIHAASDALLMPYERSIAVSSGGDTSAYASPMKAFEYMAAGRAILASDLPVIREVLSEATAMLLEPESLVAWDDGLRRVRDDVELRGRLGAEARRQVRPYSWENRARRAVDGILPEQARSRP